MESLGFPPITIAVFVTMGVVAFAIDLYAHRGDQPIGLRSAMAWTVFWIAISLAFAGYLYFTHGSETASLFITGYTLEKVLSIDNLFVFIAIFSWFAIPDGMRHRILYWGIIGAIVFRLIFVAIGTSLLSFGPWVEVVFGLIVAATAVMMLKAGDDDDEIQNYSDHLAIRVVRKVMPIWPKITGHKFFLTRSAVEKELAKPSNAGVDVARKGFLYATPLFLCLAVIEVSDVMFAFDSVPAVIAVSQDPLIVYSAMMFAILGLRTMYFVLEALRRYLSKLELAVIVVLFFIAFKLLLNATNHLFHHGYDIGPNVSLFIVLGVLGVGIVYSVLFPDDDENSEQKTKAE